MAGKSDIITGALEGIIDSFTAAKQLFVSPKQEGDMVRTLREGDDSKGQTGVVSKISGDGTVVTVDFPDLGMQYKYFAEDVVPSTGVAEIDMKIEDFYFNNPNANLKQSATPQESERDIYQKMIDESKPTTRASSSTDEFSSAGYPSNLTDEDKIEITKGMMKNANNPNNPFLEGSTGLGELFIPPRLLGKKD